MWLIRDHQLAFKKSPKDEMLSMLERQERRQLEEFFSDSDCFPLPRPVESDSQLRARHDLAECDMKVIPSADLIDLR